MPLPCPPCTALPCPPCLSHVHDWPVGFSFGLPPHKHSCWLSKHLFNWLIAPSWTPGHAGARGSRNGWGERLFVGFAGGVCGSKTFWFSGLMSNNQVQTKHRPTPAVGYSSPSPSGCFCCHLDKQAAFVYPGSQYDHLAASASTRQLYSMPTTPCPYPASVGRIT